MEAYWRGEVRKNDSATHVIEVQTQALRSMPNQTANGIMGGSLNQKFRQKKQVQQKHSLWIMDYK